MMLVFLLAGTNTVDVLFDSGETQALVAPAPSLPWDGSRTGSPRARWSEPSSRSTATCCGRMPWSPHRLPALSVRQ